MEKKRKKLLWILNFPHTNNVVVQSLSDVQLFATPWTAAHQATLPMTISRSLLKLLSIESVIFNCRYFKCNDCLQSFPASGSFLMSQFFTSGGQSIGASASSSVLPMNTQGWFPLGLTGLISSQSKGLSSIFSNTTIQKYQFFSSQPSSWSNCHIHTRLLEKS